MRLPFETTLSLLALVGSQVSAVAIPEPVTEDSLVKHVSYPFKQLVAFGDELSDNGSGSFAHGITGNPAKVYGSGTWTNGPVAAMYLADILDVPLRDFAFGGCCGGSSSGATINNQYTKAAAKWKNGPVPSVHQQIHDNYIASSPARIHETLQFIWTGQNDLSTHTDAFWLGDSHNIHFYNNISSRILHNAELLVEAGAPHVFVAGIYPKNLAPVTAAYLCKGGTCAKTWGQVIQNANNAIHHALKNSEHASKFIFYDTYSYMVDLMNHKDAHGFTVPLTWFCDGAGEFFY